LERVHATADLPRSIRVDHGTECTSKALDAWASPHHVALAFTRPGQPTDNGHIASCNARLRDARVNVHQFA